MDDRSIELARQGLDIAYQELSPGYRQIGELLSRELVINERQDSECIEALKNARLLLDFVNLLPQAAAETKHGIRTSFEVHTPAEARAIQSSVLWMRTWSAGIDFSGAGPVGFAYPTFDFIVQPYWVLGESYKTRSTKQFLLAPASSPTHRGDVDRGNYVDLASWSPVHRLLNRVENNLIVFSPSRKDQDRISTLSSKYFDTQLRDDERYPRSILHRDEDADTVSMHARLAMHKLQPLPGITDFQLAALGVFEKTYRIAALFDKKDELDTLLQEYGQEKH